MKFQDFLINFDLIEWLSTQLLQVLKEGLELWILFQKLGSIVCQGELLHVEEVNAVLNFIWIIN